MWPGKCSVQHKISDRTEIYLLQWLLVENRNKYNQYVRKRSCKTHIHNQRSNSIIVIFIIYLLLLCAYRSRMKMHVLYRVRLRIFSIWCLSIIVSQTWSCPHKSRAIIILLCSLCPRGGKFQACDLWAVVQHVTKKCSFISSFAHRITFFLGLYA